MEERIPVQRLKDGRKEEEEKQKEKQELLEWNWIGEKKVKMERVREKCMK